MHHRQLANGLRICLLENRQAPVVTSVLFYQVGCRDEPAGRGGIAHFLEHMMFKGSARFGPGEIDRRTQSLGGTNNAFTSQDTTAYYFNFAADRWTEGLAIEADRLSGLTLDPEQVASERQVILEEIAMYNSEPWDALELAVLARLFGTHPYARPVLGTRPELLEIDAAALRDFHRGFYRPDNAILVVAGSLGEEAFDEIEATLGTLPPGDGPILRRPPTPLTSAPTELVRIVRRKGEVARFLLALPAPPGRHDDHPALRLLVTLLAAGRASRLYRQLVEEQQLCVWVASDLSEGLDASYLTVTAEVIPGVDPGQVEAEIFRVLAETATEAAPREEVERAQQIVFADWVFGHEKVHQQALTAGFALTLFDLDHIERHLRTILETTPDQLQAVAARYLVPEQGGVLGWSLPRPS